LIADAKTNDLLGIHMIGPHVTDLISEASLAFVLDATPDELAYTIHPHPTLSEIFSEASLMAEGRPIHL
jgi:dihydrolipoamide dehydrogenase